MLEKNLQSKCIEYLKKNNIYYLNKYGDGRSSKGAPDLFVCLNGKFIVFELKVGKNGLSDAQKIQKKRIEQSGGLHFTPYTLDEFIKTVEELKNGVHYFK